MTLTGHPGQGHRGDLGSDLASGQVTALLDASKRVPADDGALVMEWTKAEDMHVRRGPGGQQPPSTAGLAVRDARVLTPLGGRNNDHHPAAGVSRTAGYPARDEPAVVPGVTAIRERASR